MGDIITLATAIVGCMLGVYNFAENIYANVSYYKKDKI